MSRFPKDNNTTIQNPIPSPSSTIIVENEYEVESIIGFCFKTNLYHIKWFGFRKAEATWEPRHNLTNCNELLEATDALIKSCMTTDDQEWVLKRFGKSIYDLTLVFRVQNTQVHVIRWVE